MGKRKIGHVSRRYAPFEINRFKQRLPDWYYLILTESVTRRKTYLELASPGQSKGPPLRSRWSQSFKSWNLRWNFFSQETSGTARLLPTNSKHLILTPWQSRWTSRALVSFGCTWSLSLIRSSARTSYIIYYLFRSMCIVPPGPLQGVSVYGSLCTGTCSQGLDNFYYCEVPPHPHDQDGIRNDPSSKDPKQIWAPQPHWSPGVWRHHRALRTRTRQHSR